MSRKDPFSDPLLADAFAPSMSRRAFVRSATVGTVVIALGGAGYCLASEEEEKKARATIRPDGRPKLPPSQYLLNRIRPMGGVEGDPSPSGWRLQVSGEVEQPFTLDMAELLKMTQVDQTCDVHCVTKWTVLDAKWTGVKLAELAARAKVKPSARHVIFEGFGGYTANVRLARGARAERDARAQVRGAAARPRARRAGADHRSGSLFLEEHEVDHGRALRCE